MSDITYCVLAEARALPNRIDEIVEIFAPLVEKGRQAPACERYELWQDGVNPRHFVVLQEWTSEDDMVAHLTSPEVQAMGFKLGELVEGAPQVSRYLRVL